MIIWYMIYGYMIYVYVIDNTHDSGQTGAVGVMVSGN